MGFHVELNNILRSDEPETVVEQTVYDFRKTGSRIFFDDIPIWLTRMDWTAIAEIQITRQARTPQAVEGQFRVLHVYSAESQAWLTTVFRRMYSFDGQFDPYFYLLETERELRAASERGFLVRHDLKDNGFIHASPAGQLTRVANKYYRDVKDLRCAVVAKNKVLAQIKYEPATAGVYPHIFGPLNMDAIEQIVDIVPGANGLYDIDIAKLLAERNLTNPSDNDRLQRTS
ncbi:MAG: DUF952 domain-containing protein [Planctomycetaceae bacterium]|nr:DUF952 domain-containing protein [Planctomycetaceae bacterium]